MARPHGYADLGVLEDDAVLGPEAELGGALEEALGVRLAGADALGRHHDVRKREPGGPHTGPGEGVVGGGHEGVRQALRPQGGHERRGAGDRHDAVDVGGLLGEQLAVLRVVLLHRALRQQHRHRGVPLAAVHDADDGVAVQTVPRGPAAPAALDHRVGVHERAVHVQQQGAGGQRHTCSSGEYSVAPPAGQGKRAEPLCSYTIQNPGRFTPGGPPLGTRCSPRRNRIFAVRRASARW